MRLGGEGVSITETTEKKCIRAAQVVKAEYLAGKKADRQKEKKLLRDACTEYIEQYRSRLSPTTIQGYEKIRDNNLQGIMDKDIYVLSAKDVDDAVAEECKKPGRTADSVLSPKTVRNICGFVFPIIRKYNPDAVEGIRLPEIKKIPARILRPEDVYCAVRGTDIELPCLLAMWLTLSMSEIRGLTKSKSLSGNQLAVVETVVDINGKPVRKPGGKEEYRSRVLNVPKYIMDLVNKVEGDIICPLSSQAINKRLQRLLIKAGLQPISFHKLRHIAASTMVAIGIPDDYILAQGGWKTSYVLNRTYKHIFSPEQQEYTDMLDEKFAEIIKNVN
jgi:integrase